MYQSALTEMGQNLHGVCLSAVPPCDRERVTDRWKDKHKTNAFRLSGMYMTTDHSDRHNNALRWQAELTFQNV